MIGREDSIECPMVFLCCSVPKDRLPDERVFPPPGASEGYLGKMCDSVVFDVEAADEMRPDVNDEMRTKVAVTTTVGEETGRLLLSRRAKTSEEEVEDIRRGRLYYAESE